MNDEVGPVHDFDDCFLVATFKITATTKRQINIRLIDVRLTNLQNLHSSDKEMDRYLD